MESTLDLDTLKLRDMMTVPYLPSPIEVVMKRAMSEQPIYRPVRIVESKGDS